MTKIIVVHQWHSGIGEQIMALHFFLNAITHIRSILPNCYVTYRFTFKSNLTNTDANVVKFGLHLDNIKNIVDDIEFFENDHAYYTNLSKESDTYVPLLRHSHNRGVFGQSLYFNNLFYISKESYDETLTNQLTDYIEELRHRAQFNTTSSAVRRDTKNILLFDILSNQVNSLANRYIKQKKLRKFNCLYLRSDYRPEKIGIYSGMDNESFSKTIKSTFDSTLEKNKKYFLSSNNEYIKQLYTGKHNVHTIHRTDSNRILYDIPKNIHPREVPAAFAFIELAIMTKSQHITFSMDCGRDLLSLFQWYAMYKFGIPITWIDCNGYMNTFTYDSFGFKEFKETAINTISKV